MRQKGFVIIPILIAIAVVLGGVLVFAVRTSPNFLTGIIGNKSSSPIPASQPAATPTTVPATPTLTPVKTPTPRPATPRPATPRPSTPTPVPTQAASAPSCSYQTNEPSGAISITFNLTKGSQTYYSTKVEVKAKSGCKVLDGNSTDTVAQYKSPTQPNVTFSSLPAGNYDVSFTYNNAGGSSQNVNVTSTQSTNVSFTIDNSSDP